MVLVPQNYTGTHFIFEEFRQQPTLQQFAISFPLKKCWKAVDPDFYYISNALKAEQSTSYTAPPVLKPVIFVEY